MSSCLGCKSSNKSANGILRLARKMKQLEPSNLDSCLKCVCDPCGCGCELFICADKTTVKKDIIVEGNVIGDVVGTLNGTLIGDVCAGLIKVTVQLICDIDSSVEFVVTADDMITQIRLEAAPTVPPYAGFIQSGSEGQLKIINLVAPAVVGVVEIDLGNGLILELGPDPENGTPVSAQLYYIGGSWQVFQTQNATVS